jgi:hypothetical protein
MDGLLELMRVLPKWFSGTANTEMLITRRRSVGSHQGTCRLLGKIETVIPFPKGVIKKPSLLMAGPLV